MAETVFGWHYSKPLLEKAQNNYMLEVWLIQFNDQELETPFH